MKVKMVILSPNKRERELLNKPVVGRGGMQTILRKLQVKMISNKGGYIDLTNEELKKVKQYYDNYGDGGFQRRLEGLAKVLDLID